MFEYQPNPETKEEIPYIASGLDKFLRAFKAWQNGDNDAKITIRNPELDPSRQYIRITMREYLGREAKDNVFYFRGNPDPKAKEKFDDEN